MENESHIDRIIREASERGEFDNLPGSGKPLPLRHMGDPDWWIKDLIARENISLDGLAGTTAIALRREADSFPESLLDIAHESAVREVLEDFNARVAEDWKRPQLGRGSPIVARKVDVEAMVVRWMDLREQRST
jgi:hypothetical protein